MVIYFLKFLFIFLFGLTAQAEIVDKSFRFSYLGNQFDNGYSEAKYNAVILKVKEVYEPVIHSLGGSFHILDDWSDGAVNAWAFRLGREYWLELPGGMSRYHLINEEAFILTICHELGHLLGGEPMNGVISFEGQADYFSSQQCAETLFKEIKAFAELPANQEVLRRCSKEKERKALCQRVLKGALSLTSYYAEISNKPFPKLSTPSSFVAQKTLQQHPEAQCRLDTIGAGYFNQSRPICWFKSSP